jgi:phage protein D
LASSFQILLDGQAAAQSIYDLLASVEVEESVDLPGALVLDLPVARDDSGDLTFVSDQSFRPFANVAVVAQIKGATAECIFDGYVLSHKLHLETGTSRSRLRVWGQDATILMNLEEKTKEWTDVTDADVAASIFDDYGITAASDNQDDQSPNHTEDRHSLMQRASDIQLLRLLAQRTGKLCRVFCGSRAGQRTGYFAKPKLDADAALTLALNNAEQATVTSLDFEWDVSRPSSVVARQTDLNDDDEDGMQGDSSDSGLPALADRDLATFAGRSNSVRLTAPVDDAGELTQRAQALLREAGFFVRCEGEAEATQLNAILRAGTIIQISGAGSLNSGKYLVWSVHHTITKTAHRMKFVLVRNAVGAASSGALAQAGG